MADVSPYLPDLLRLVKRHYPDWNDFTHPQFVADEIEYKHEASRLAKEMLNREALETLLAAGDYDDFLSRLKTVASKTNLLFLGVPQKGDLALISQPDSGVAPICTAIFDLLHGPDSLARIAWQLFLNPSPAANYPRNGPFPPISCFSSTLKAKSSSSQRQ